MTSDAPAQAAPQKVPVLGVGISATSYDEVCGYIAGCIGNGAPPAYVCVCNVHSVMEAHGDPAFAAVLNGAAVATPDGVPLVWALRLKGCRGQERVYGPDLMLEFCRLAVGKGYRNYLYGGGEGVPQKVAEVLTARFPGLRIVGAESPPFRPLSPEEDEAAVARINGSGADVVWVGLGCPKQERWMADHAGRIRAVLLGVGAAFDFHAGRVRPAPRWMKAGGLEWLFRLAMEPHRLWRRYLFNNPHYLWHLAGMALSRKAGP